MHRSKARWLGGLILLIFVTSGRLAATEPEDELKSATVLTFIRHSEWRQGNTGPINVAMVGKPATTQALRRPRVINVPPRSAFTGLPSRFDVLQISACETRL